PHGTFLYARYPRPVSGCAAEVSSRIAESVFVALARAIPDDLFAAPAGSSGNLTLGGFDPLTARHYIMYVFSGAGYGGRVKHDAAHQVVVDRQGAVYRSPHGSKDEDLRVDGGDCVHLRTPGGGGNGDPLARDSEIVSRDGARDYFTVEDPERDYGVVLGGE